MYKKLSVAIAATLTVACGGPDDEPKNEVDYADLEVAPQSDSSLVLAEQDTLVNHINNGLRMAAMNGDHYLRFEGGVGGSPGFDGSGDPAPSLPSADGYSDTNVHVQGVDEADYVKYDGQHWFVATEPQYQDFLISQPKPGVKIVATDPAVPSMEYVAEYAFDDEWGSVGELYLVQQDDQTTHVASLRNQWGNVYPLLPGVPFEAIRGGVVAVDGGFMEGGAVPAPTEAASDAEVQAALVATDLPYFPGPQNSQVRIDLVDVSDPAEPSKDWGVELDGSLIQSRKVGNTLYLVTRFDPWVSGLTYEYGVVETREENEKVLESVAVEQLMPYYRIGDQEQPLSTDCYIQKSAKENQGLATLVHITAIDLAAQKVVDSQCLNSNVESMSMSPKALYLTGSYFDSSNAQEKTVVHKFDLLASGPQYAATGSVVGGLGWNSDPAFRMHEYEDQFRIVTSSWANRAGPEHRLTVLQQQGESLTTLSTLPNESQPAPIGKPEEDIYSVRFEGERAYIVTFRRTDPLYAIDLADPANPSVAGELEIPGFATYMHPIGDYLFTLGNSADEDGRVTGIKAELISVANDNPELVSTIQLGGPGSSTSALRDLRAISFLPVGDDQMRIAFPVSVYQDIERGWIWDYTGVQLLTVDGITGSAVLNNAGVAKVETYDPNRQSSPRYGMSRGILHDDAVFINFGADFWAANWFRPEAVSGPLAQKPVVCTAEFRMGLSVTLNLDGELGDVSACDADVLAFDGRYSETLQARESDDPSQCQFVGAGERAGHYVIEASMEGYTGADAKVTVYRDECHVIPEEVEMTIAPYDPTVCTAQVVPSIRLSLSSSIGDPAICDSRVFVEQEGEAYPLDLVGMSASSVASPSPDGDALVAPMPPTATCLFEGPYELGGEMMLVVDSPEHQNIEQPVFVPQNECHVETQDIRLTLDPM